MCLLQSKAPPISEIDPTLFFLPIFMTYLLYFTEALSPQSPPFYVFETNIAILHIRGGICQ